MGKIALKFVILAAAITITYHTLGYIDNSKMLKERPSCYKEFFEV